jgi:GTP-binding protein HflX
MSALTGEGIEKLRTLMIEQIRKLHTNTQLFFPRSDEHRIYELGRESMINRTVCFAKLTPDQLHKWQGFLVKAR